MKYQEKNSKGEEKEILVQANRPMQPYEQNREVPHQNPQFWCTWSQTQGNF
jgi:hypothetical protein